MPKNNKFNKTIDALSYILVALAVAGLIVGSIGLYRNIAVMQISGVSVLIGGFVLFVLKFPLLSVYNRNKQKEDIELVNAITGDYHLKIEEIPQDLSKRKQRAAAKKRRKFVAKQVKYQNCIKEKTEREKNKKEKIIEMQAVVSRKKKLKKEVHLCDNCGTTMHKNIRDEWKCPICDTRVDIDMSVLIESAIQIKIRKAEAKVAARKAQEEEDAREEAALRQLREEHGVKQDRNPDASVVEGATVTQAENAVDENKTAKKIEEHIYKATQKELEIRAAMVEKKVKEQEEVAEETVIIVDRTKESEIADVEKTARAIQESAKKTNEAKAAAEAKARDVEAKAAAEAKARDEARAAAEAKARDEARAADEAKARDEAKAAADEARAAADEARAAADEARAAAEAKARDEAKAAAEAKARDEARTAAEAKARDEARTAAEAKARDEAALKSVTEKQPLKTTAMANDEFDWDQMEETAESFDKPTFASSSKDNASSDIPKQSHTEKPSTTSPEPPQKPSTKMTLKNAEIEEDDMEEIIERASKKVLSSLIASITGAVSENVSDLMKEKKRSAQKKAAEIDEENK